MKKEEVLSSPLVPTSHNSLLNPTGLDLSDHAIRLERRRDDRPIHSGKRDAQTGLDEPSK